MFSLSLQNVIFPDKLKIARVTTILKGGYKYDLGNCRPISVLLCFSEILEKIMCNRLYKYVTDNSIFYKKTVWFSVWK